MFRRPACPRCQVPLAKSQGGRVCRGCGGVFLGASRVGLSVTFGMVMDEIIAHGLPSFPCPVCQETMTRLALPNQEVEWCRGCGGMWLDAKEALERPGPASSAAISRVPPGKPDPR